LGQFVSRYERPPDRVPIQGTFTPSVHAHVRRTLSAWSGRGTARSVSTSKHSARRHSGRVLGDFTHDADFPAAVWRLHSDSTRREVFGQHTDVGYRALWFRLRCDACLDVCLDSEDTERQDAEETVREDAMRTSPNKTQQPTPVGALSCTSHLSSGEAELGRWPR